MSEVKQDIFNTTTTDSSSKDNKITNDEKTIQFQINDDTGNNKNVQENTEPWKPHGPWYKDVTKRRWFAFGLIAFLIVIVIIVVPISVSHAIKDKYCLFSNSSEEADDYFFGSSPIVEDDNSNLNTTIKELNLRIKNILRADPIIQKIVFNGRKVTDGDKDLQYYGIKKNSVLHLDLLPFSPSPSSFKDKKDKKKKNIIFKRFINPNFINKLYDNAFTLYNDFGDNKYSSSSSQYLKLAELYSKIFYFKGEKYKVIFQHLVKEKSLVKIKRFDIRNDRLDEYWVSPCENELKPFGVLVKKVENCD
ncbi:6509_t:CDS:2 [Entrophospora sp. SA101]|nr:6509_t:CDS:2 [Entrophospora sp. SA101]